MAVSIIRRPDGFILDSTNLLSASVTDSSGEALFTTAFLSIVEGSVIYVKSDVSEYNGFFYTYFPGVPGLFKLYRNDGSVIGSDIVPYIKDTNALFYFRSASHRWNCVHLPIVYKLSNTLWPTNSADTIRTISSVTDSNGYCNITASGDIKTTGSAAVLEFVKITNATDDDLNGVWQIITYSSDTSFILDIPYSTANDTALTNASIQYYYNNYVVKVQVWGGLNNGHTYYGQKPYELLATLDLIPDEDNICMFSISEILKKQIEIENNLLLGTLPNNLDAWTGFFIKYGEEFDDSDGTILSRSTVSYTSDLASFEGYAVNAELPFKNVYSGAMSEYVSEDTNQKFLTNWVQPTIFEGKYFDLGFIWNPVVIFNPELAVFVNDAAAGTSWSLGPTPAVTITGPTDSKLLRAPVSEVTDAIKTYTVFLTLAFTAGAADPAIEVSFLNSSFVSVSTTGTVTVSTGTNNYVFQIQGHASAVYLAFQALADSGTSTYTISSYSITDGALILLQEGTVQTALESVSPGVYRAQLTDPNCDNSTVSASIKEAFDIGFINPIYWTDTTGTWDSKTFTTFVEAVTSATGSIESYMPLIAETGDVVEVTLTVVVTGTAVFSGTGILVYFNLKDGAGSGVGTITSVLPSINANGTYTYTVVISADAASERLALFLLESSITSGTANVTITVPETVRVIKPDAVSETKTIDINCKCVPSQAEEGIYLSWLNNLGHFDYWFFTAHKDHIINITDSGETKVNTFPNWPNSYGEFSDTIRKQTYRDSETQILVRSQHLTKDQLTQIQSIKTSPLVQIVNSIYDRRTVKVDTDSFTVYQEEQKLYQIQFTITYTDDVPSQRV